MDKESLIYTHTYIYEYYHQLSSIKKEICHCDMDFEGIMLSEIGQTEKGKYYMLSCTKALKNKQTPNNLVEKEIRFIITRGGRNMMKVAKRFKIPVIR